METQIGIQFNLKCSDTELNCYLLCVTIEFLIYSVSVLFTERK